MRSKLKHEKKALASVDKKKFYNLVRSSSNIRPTIGPLKINGELTDEIKKLAKYANEFIASVYENDVGSTIPRYPPAMKGFSLNTISFTDENIENNTRKIKTTASGGSDGNNGKPRKEVSEDIVAPL